MLVFCSILTRSTTNTYEDDSHFTHPEPIEGITSHTQPSINFWLQESYSSEIIRPISPVEPINFRIESEALTVYNPSPIMIDGVIHLWARTEEPGKETGGDVRLFTEAKDGLWDQVEGAPIFEGLQDPFYCGVVDGYHVMGGVEVYEIPGHEHLGYRTVFYKYIESPNELNNASGGMIEPFAHGPSKMKGIRIVELEAGRIGVFTRPQGMEFGDRGQVGYFEIESLGELESKLESYVQEKDSSTFIKDLFLSQEASGDGEWGGVNQAIPLPDGRIFILGHSAGYFGKDHVKCYYPTTFIFDPRDRTISNFQIIATDRQYPPVEPKDPKTMGIIYYPGGIIKDDSGLKVYYGIGDHVCAKQGINVRPVPYINS